MSDLREALSNAITEAETKDEPTSAPPQEVEASAPSEPTDLAERSSVEETDLGAETPAEEVAGTTAEPKEVAAKPATDKPVESPTKPSRVDRPPTNWKGGAKGEWASVPLSVRQEVHRIEQEVQKVMRETAPVRQFAEQFNQAVAPYKARIDSYGANPVQAVQNLLQVDYALSSAPKVQRAQLMAKLIKDYEVDFVELDNALSGKPQTAAPAGEDIEQRILQRVQQMVAPVFQREQQVIQQKQQQVASTIESMAQDHINYPYFNEVREDMADLIDMKTKRGIDMSLEQAYAIATRSNPEVASQLERQTSMTGANQQHLQAQRAKAAASSVSGAPAFGGTGSFQGNGSLRGALEAAFNSNRV